MVVHRSEEWFSGVSSRGEAKQKTMIYPVGLIHPYV
jgi:hypothetical protein